MWTPQQCYKVQASLKHLSSCNSYPDTAKYYLNILRGAFLKYPKSSSNISFFATKLLLVAACAGLIGCATTNQVTEAEYNTLPGERFPATAIYYQKPGGEFQNECTEFAKLSLLHHCTMNDFDLSKVHIELSNTELFEGVGYAQDDLDYHLLIGVAGYNRESGEDLGNAVISGATLMLVPMTTSIQLKVDALLLWNGEPLKRYQYEIPFETSVSLFSNHEDAETDIARSVASHLVKGFQDDNIYSQDYLHKHLDSTNYETDLVLPEEVGNFLKSESYKYHNPLLGIQTRFTHQDFQFDYVDTFVYPIAHWTYKDHKQVLEREAKNIRNDMNSLEQSGGVETFEVGEDRIEQWDLQGNPTPVLSFSGSFVDNNGIPFQTHTYLTIKEDKLVKLRATFAQTGQSPDSIDTFAKDFYPQVQIPKESEFMSKLRKEWRKGSLFTK